ncbi:hypothetical protein AGMMS50268_00910 [Spirochaetia bacterium]|nr:hypothetical protein AGMMS50268_00910 [Spirochaetia bacterium]
MKKSIALCVFTVFLVSALFAQTMSTRPVWIDALHDFDSADVVYFVGKSAQGGSENYLEAKGSAIADVLTQFTLYKEVKIRSMVSGYELEGGETPERISSYERVSTILGGNINTGGLYQCEEYADPQGTVFVRFGYHKNSPVFERFAEVPKEISEYWEPSKDKVYFLIIVWSTNRNAQELRALAKEDAALQASLWLGSSLSFMQEQYSKTEEKNGEKTDMESLKILMECIGSYQTLQEEGYAIGERKNSGIFSCIALYSIKRDAVVSRPEIKEM